QVDPEAASEALRLLSERREDLVAERTRALNRLHALLRDLVPGGVARTLSADRAARILRGIRPKGTSVRLRRRLASEVLRDVRTLDRKIVDLDTRVQAEVEASGTTLTEIFGVGPILAATILGRGRQRYALPYQSPLRLLLGHGAGGSLERRGGAPQALAGRQPQAQLRPAHGRRVPGQVGCSGRSLLP
ncbi:MAG TPA: hypothetical protein VFX77_03495, partial [Rubrobacter sp.]|nr:hypothetical protein [Rubrobacter sp.]